MISKQNFIKYIDKLKELRSAEDALNSAGKLLDFSISFAEYEQLIVDVLEDAFDDQGFNWISYFIYELNFGSEWCQGCIEMNGEDVFLSNASELYDVLVRD